MEGTEEMADSAATRTTTRKRPRGTARPAQSDTNGTAKTPRAKALYHVYSEDDERVLSPLGEFEGRNASEAIEDYLDAGNKADGITFVVVPDRNLARVEADVETRTKVKLRAV